jgi:uncharacterized protein (TIGR03435 family)
MRAIPSAALIIGALCQAFGQSAPPARKFEVASVKVRQGAPQWKFAISGTRLTIESYTLFGLVREAYSLRNYQIQRTGAPPLLSSDDTLYDITAKADGDSTPTRDEFRQMLQSLLADRFRIKIHREQKEMPVYALVVGKNGPKFHASAPDADPQAHFGFSGANNEYSMATMPKTTMQGLADNLSPVQGRPVLDRTGLTGTWGIKLFSTPEYKMSRGPEPNPGELSILTAVQEQLGLRLEPQKATIEIFVVDSVEKPSEN